MDNDDLVNSNNQLQLTHAGHEAEFLFFTTPDGKMNVEVWYAGETIWLSQKRMGEFFGVESNTITYHFERNLQKWRTGGGFSYSNFSSNCF